MEILFLPIRVRPSRRALDDISALAILLEVRRSRAHRARRRLHGRRTPRARARPLDAMARPRIPLREEVAGEGPAPSVGGGAPAGGDAGGLAGGAEALALAVGG